MILYYLNDDCFNVMKQYNNIDAIISDIPYGIGFHGEKDPDTDWDKFSEEEYVLFLEKFFDSSYKCTKNDAIMFIFVAPTKISDVLSCNKEWIFRPEYSFYYCRAKGRGSKNKLKSLREDILCFSKKEDTLLNFDEVKDFENYRKEIKKPIGYALDICSGERIPQFSYLDRSFYVTPPAYNNVAEKQIHSCQKPVLLFTELIMLASKVGDTVLDPFMGSGASGVAAHICERNYTGIEMERDMYDKANKWKNDLLDPSTRVYEHIQGYIKKRVSSGEKGFKFGFHNRHILPKKEKK